MEQKFREIYTGFTTFSKHGKPTNPQKKSEKKQALPITTSTRDSCGSKRSNKQHSINRHSCSKNTSANNGSLSWSWHAKKKKNQPASHLKNARRFITHKMNESQRPIHRIHVWSSARKFQNESLVENDHQIGERTGGASLRPVPYSRLWYTTHTARKEYTHQ